MSQVNELISKGQSTGARLAAWEEIQTVLLDKKLAWYAHASPDHVGVHPCNRSKLGVGGSEAHHHGARILQAGFSWKKSSDATAFECPPEPHDADAKAENDTLVNLSGGLIPPLAQLKLLSVGGGHTNTFLRAVNASCSSAVQKLADERGVLNPEQLCIGRPTFREALEKGLKWLVIHWQAPQVWPELPHFVQSALNTHSSTQQSEVEVMLGMHQLHTQAVALQREADWSHIQEVACYSMPPCAPYIATLASYVQANSGGIAGELLQELAAFSKAFACSEQGPNRALGSEFMARLMALTKAWGGASVTPTS